MKKILLLISITIGLFALTSCLDGPNSGGETKLKNGFRVNVDVEKTESELVTRTGVAPEPGEENLKTLYLLFFERTENQSGVLKGHHAITSGLVMDTDIDINFDPTSGLLSTEAYNVLAVSNISDNDYLGMTVDMWLTSLSGKTEKQVADATRGHITGLNDGALGGSVAYNTNLIMPNGIIMSAKGVKEANQAKLKLVLKRGVTRFDVINSKFKDYNLVSVSIWNAYPESPMWEGAGMDFNRARIERLYGITTTKVNDPNDPDREYKDILGGLYSFGNYVTAPELNDANTTCLIIGIEDRTSGTKTFYRVNLHPKDSGQSLKRNNVYRLTVRGVIAAGATTEIEAFKNNENKLSFVINYWDLDSDGMIQYDGTNVLGIPTKSIHLPPEGDTREYSVFTFGDGTLALSQKILDQGLDVELIGNTLRVKATALDIGQVERKGIVEVSFASLKASINIRQSGDMDQSLELSVATIAPFPSYKNASMAGGVIVAASGKWRARIFPPNDERFSFTTGVTGKYVITSDDVEATGGQFRISTHKDNDENTLAYGFVLVELVDDPTINRTLLLTQLGKSDITYEPANVSEVRFEPNKDFVESATNKNVFIINSGIEIVSPETFYDWKAEMIGVDAAAFSVAITKNLNVLSGNTITITANAANSLSRALIAQVKISLVGQPTVSITINVRQATYSFSLFPSTLSAIGVRGGDSDLIEVRGDNSLNWIANITMSHSDANSSRPGTLKDHAAYLVDGTTGLKLVLGQAYPMTTKFRVVYPMMYYPNTHMTPSAKVVLSLAESSTTTATISVGQAPLLPRKVIAQSFNAGWCTFFTNSTETSPFFEGALDSFRNRKLFGANGIVRTDAIEPYAYTSYYGTVGDIPSGVTWAHGTRPRYWNLNYQNALRVWQKESTANWLMAMPSEAVIEAYPPLLTERGYSNGGLSRTADVKQTTDDAVLNSKVGKYIFETGPFCRPGDLPIRDLRFSTDGVNGTSATTPEGSYVLVRGSNASGSDKAMITIDFKNQMVVIGEGHIFSYLAPVNSDNESSKAGAANEVVMALNPKTKMLRNIMAFMFNAVQYGDHFTDTFKE